jgi:predicted  nucleic acid-binding Zn-ribbon protein
MQVHEILDRVGAKMLGVGRVMIQADPASDLREELDHLRGEHARQDDRLATLRGQVALLLQRLAENEAAASSLPAAVESSFRRNKSAQAMRQALELDRIRRELDADRTELKRVEHAVWCLEFRLRQLSRRIERLSEGLS